VRAIVGFYLTPPDKALLLCVDEKTQIQALDRTQPLLPIRPGQVQRRAYDYRRHGTTSLFAALDVKSGCHRRHRPTEFHLLSKSLLRHGCRPPAGATPWTQKDLGRVRTDLRFVAPAQEAVRLDYLHEVERAGERIARLELAIDAAGRDGRPRRMRR